MSSTTTTLPIVIIGAGAAGLACALSAAKQGEPVILIEKSQMLGGTVTQALIHTLGGLFDDQGTHLNTGLPVELTERLTQASSYTCQRRIGKTMTLSVDPSVYKQVVSDWLAEFPLLAIHHQATVTDLLINEGRIERICIKHRGKIFNVQPKIVVDTTGHADIVRLAGGQVNDGKVLAGLVMQVRNITPNALQFPKGVALLRHIRKAVENGILPTECATLWLDKGVHPDEVYVKFSLLPDSYHPQHMEQVAKQLLAYLVTHSGFENALLHRQGQLGLREGGQVQGDYTLTEDDLRQGRQFSDGICQGNWPIEYWHPQRGVSLDYFPSGHQYDIPLRALKAQGLANLFVAGKCLSAEPHAQASARVVGTCWAMGDGLIQALIKGVSSDAT